jgi:hypothetical protein
MRIAVLLASVVVATASWPAAGQQASAPAPQAAAPSTAEFAYRADGRRDPFVSLVGRGPEPRPGTGRHVDGPAGLAVSELSVRGLVSTPGGFVAMVQGADTKTYLVRPNERLLDGTITAITAQGLVILQHVTDPLSRVKTREVRKGLRSSEEGT